MAGQYLQELRELFGMSVPEKEKKGIYKEYNNKVPWTQTKTNAMF